MEHLHVAQSRHHDDINLETPWRHLEEERRLRKSVHPCPVIPLALSAAIFQRSPPQFLTIGRGEALMLFKTGPGRFWWCTDIISLACDFRAPIPTHCSPFMNAIWFHFTQQEIAKIYICTIDHHAAEVGSLRLHVFTKLLTKEGFASGLLLWTKNIFHDFPSVRSFLKIINKISIFFEAVLVFSLKRV